MRKTIIVLTFVGAWVTLCPASHANARVDVHVGIAIPPPPTVVFESQPTPILVPHSRVYYAPAPDYDVYRYGGRWYVNRDGYWYVGPSYQGPFAPIVYERVPHSILVVPGDYHRHPFRPGVRHVSGPDYHRNHHDAHRGDGDHHGNHGGGDHDHGRHEGHSDHDHH